MAGQSGATGPSLSEIITLQWQGERGDLDLQNFLLAIYFVRVATLVQRADDRQCQKHYGISANDMRLLLALRRSGPPYVKRPTDLFRTLLVTSGAITKKVDRMVEMGYVERMPDPAHMGGFLVQLTKKGLRVVDQRVEYLANHSVLAPALAQFSPEERKRGMEFVLKTLSALETSALHAGEEDDAAPDEPASRPAPGRRKSRQQPARGRSA